MIIEANKRQNTQSATSTLYVLHMHYYENTCITTESSLLTLQYDSESIINIVCCPGASGPAGAVPIGVHERVPDGAARLPDLDAVHHMARHR